MDAFTRGLKKDKKYLWYSVWDIWRRLPFVAVNLLISVAPVSIIVVSIQWNLSTVDTTIGTHITVPIIEVSLIHWGSLILLGHYTVSVL